MEHYRNESTSSFISQTLTKGIYHQRGKAESRYGQKSQQLPVQSMEELRAHNPTEEKRINYDLADKRIWDMVIQKTAAISWTEQVTNEEVFNKANSKPTLLDALLNRRLAFHGHLVRKAAFG